MTARRRIAVTGLGIVSPVGIGVADAWAAIVAGKSGIARITRFDPAPFPSQIAGEVKDFDVTKWLSGKEARRYDAVPLRDTRLAMMDRATFMWLFENSVGFNRFLVALLNERVGQFMGLLEYGRMLDAKARLARSIASLFNPILYPDVTSHLEITQEELGAISGISRQNTNQCLKTLEKEGLLRIEYGGVTIVDLERLRTYGE